MGRNNADGCGGGFCAVCLAGCGDHIVFGRARSGIHAGLCDGSTSSSNGPGNGFVRLPRNRGGELYLAGLSHRRVRRGDADTDLLRSTYDDNG